MKLVGFRLGFPHLSGAASHCLRAIHSNSWCRMFCTRPTGHEVEALLEYLFSVSRHLLRRPKASGKFYKGERVSESYSHDNQDFQSKANQPTCGFAAKPNMILWLSDPKICQNNNWVKKQEPSPINRVNKAILDPSLIGTFSCMNSTKCSYPL